MESQSLLPSPKQKKGSPPLLAMVSTALLLLGLGFYGGEYWGSHHRASGDSRICNHPPCAVGEPCISDKDCATPPGLTHGVCGQDGLDDGLCQSGQAGSICLSDTSACVVRTDLVPPHPVCRHDKCQQ